MHVKSLMMTVVCGTALLAAPAYAQARPLPVQKPPTHAQMGSAGPVTPPATPRNEVDRAHRGGSYYRGGDDYRGGWRYANVPVMVTNDGRVYANFGYGYERVLRACSSAPAMTRYRTRQEAPRQPTPKAYSLPEYTQPVPRAQTSSQAMIAQHPGNAGAAQTMYTGTPTTAANSACWTRLSNGGITVLR